MDVVLAQCGGAVELGDPAVPAAMPAAPSAPATPGEPAVADASAAAAAAAIPGLISRLVVYDAAQVAPLVDELNEIEAQKAAERKAEKRRQVLYSTFTVVLY